MQDNVLHHSSRIDFSHRFASLIRVAIRWFGCGDSKSAVPSYYSPVRSKTAPIGKSPNNIKLNQLKTHQREASQRSRIDNRLCNVYFAQMATKTVSLTIDAYEKLRNARKSPSESFSQVVLRATWPEESITAREWRARLKATKPLLTKEELEVVDSATRNDLPPSDKWQNR